MMIHTTELEKKLTLEPLAGIVFKAQIFAGQKLPVSRRQSRIHAEQRLSTDNAFSLSTSLNAVAIVGVI